MFFCNFAPKFHIKIRVLTIYKAYRMKNLLSKKAFVAFAAGAMLLSSCHDNDIYDPNDIVKDYADNWQKTFGDIDPNQDWNLATSITVNAQLDIPGSSVMKIYTTNPLDSESRLLAITELNNGVGSISFDAIKGSTSLFVTIHQDNEYIIFDNYSVENGQINIDSDTNTTRTSTRTIEVGSDVYNEFNFPTAEELAAVFPTSIPEGADEIKDLTGDLYWVYLGNGAGHNYKVTKTGEVTIGGSWKNEAEGGGYATYNVYVSVEGNVTIKRDGVEHYNLYILKGNVTLDSNYGECGGVISVAKGATLNDKRSSIAHNGGIDLYNRGTIKTGAYDIGNKATVYNEGKFEASGALSYSAGAGNTSRFINWGDDVELTAPSMTLNSTCHFFTDGTVKITGETKVTQSGIVWVNNGHYTTKTMTFSAKNGTFYNYCQLIVTDVCYFTDGKFNNMDNSYAEFGKGLFNNFHVMMGNNSGFNVKEGSIFGRQGQGTFQGFEAKDDVAKAYVRLDGTTKVFTHNGAAFHVKGANLTLAYNDMKFYNDSYYFSTSDFDSSWNNFYSETTKEELEANNDGRTTWDLHNVKKIITGDYFEETSFTTKKGECAATWDGPTIIPTPSEVEVKDTPNSWIIACEDLGSKDDIDFNDVVFSVEYVAGTTTATVTPLAAGGIYSAEIGYIGDDSFIYEVHEWFNRPGENGSQLMLNTGVDSGANEDGVTATSKTVTVPKNFKLSYNAANQTNMGGFFIKVSSTSKATTILGSGVGEAPQMILVPGTWKWPKERIKIYDAYPQFENWSKNDNDINTNWYNFPDNDTSLLYGGDSTSGGGAADSEYGVSLAQYIVSKTTIPASVFEPYKETGAVVTVTAGTDPSWLEFKCILYNPNGGWYFADWNIKAGAVRTITLTKENISDIIKNNGLEVEFSSNHSLEDITGFYIKAAN